MRIRAATAAILLLAPAASSASTVSAPDSLFEGAASAERLRPPREARAGPAAGSVPIAAGAVLLSGALVMFLTLRSVSRTRTNRGSGGSLERRLDRIEERAQDLQGGELCRELLSVLRRDVEESRPGGWPPGRPVRQALPPDASLRRRLRRWDRIRFGDAPMDPEDRQEAVEAVRERLRKSAPPS